MSKIITFYSYKGGVGRSMALVNVATLLSKWGKKVLMIDWDLEAPGLEYFFKKYLPDTDWTKQKGLLEYLFAKQNKEDAKWQEWVLSFKTDLSTVPLNLLVSGKENGEYTDMLRAFNVSKFYEEHDGGHIIESFRGELLASYDYILIDSRTGVTDFGGICTVQLPDILIMLFTPTEQGLQGTIKIAKRVAELHKQQPVDRYKLLICPVPSRIDATAEFKTTRDWLERVAADLGFLYREWMPESLIGVEFLEKIKIPYFPHFSYGEKIPVIEQGTGDPAGLGYAYENLAMLVGRGLDYVDVFVEKRENYLEEISGEKLEDRLPENISKPIVNIYISYVDEDKEIKKEIVELIRYRSESFLLEILELKNLKLGESKSEAIKKMLDFADVVILLISKNYAKDYFPEFSLFQSPIYMFNKPKPFNEYSTIEKYNHKMTIPIYLDTGISNIPPFIVDRMGVPVDNRLTVNDIKIIIDELMSILSQVYQGH